VRRRRRRKKGIEPYFLALPLWTKKKEKKKERLLSWIGVPQGKRKMKTESKERKKEKKKMRRSEER
jgi:hypothetical protein